MSYQGGKSSRRVWIVFAAFIVMIAGVVGGLAWWQQYGQNIDFADFTRKGSERSTRSSRAAEIPHLFYQAIGANPPASSPESNSPSYTVELRVLKSKRRAEAYVDLLASQGISAYYTPLARRGNVVYRVRRGVYKSKKSAVRAAEKIAQSKRFKNLKPRVVALR